MNANTLKTAVSSILYVADEDIAKLNALVPEDGIEHKASYYNDLAQIACHVGDSMDAVQELLTQYAGEIANTEDVFANIDITALTERITNAIKNGAERLNAVFASANAGAGLDSLKLRKAPIYGVSGLYDSATALTRTDDAVGMSYTIDRETGCIHSDFDNAFPWNKTKIVDLPAGKFVSFPEMYFRIGVDAACRITDVAVSAEPSGSGKWYKVEPFMYGCYGASVAEDKLRSVSGVDRANCCTRETFRKFAANNGDGYFQLDLYHRNVLLLLWLIEWATKDSASVMAGRIYKSGNSGGWSRRPTGGTDSVETPSGFETEYGQMRWHYIEDFVGNIFEMVDGICLHGENQKDFVTDDPACFSDTDEGKRPLSYNNPKNGEIAALGWDESNPFLFMPIETVENEDNDTYFCNEVYHFAGNPVLYCGAIYNYAGAYCGVFYLYSGSAGNAGGNLGARLLKKS